MTTNAADVLRFALAAAEDADCGVLSLHPDSVLAALPPEVRQRVEVALVGSPTPESYEQESQLWATWRDALDEAHAGWRHRCGDAHLSCGLLATKLAEKGATE